MTCVNAVYVVHLLMPPMLLDPRKYNTHALLARLQTANDERRRGIEAVAELARYIFKDHTHVGSWCITDHCRPCIGVAYMG